MNKKLKLWELNRKTEAEFRKQEKFPIVLVLDDIRSLNNIGSFFFFLHAFNIEKIFLCGITAIPPHRDIHKTALGATETVNWEHQEQIMTCIQSLKRRAMSFVLLSKPNKPYCFKRFQSLTQNLSHWCLEMRSMEWLKKL